MKAKRVLFVAIAGVALLVGPLAGIAAAHVTVSSEDATAGGYATVTLRVPTEKDVPTTKIELAMPTDTPIASVLVEPKPGWTVDVTKAAPSQPLSSDDGPVSEVVSRVIWTATDKGIDPGQFDRFTIAAGPLPDADQVVFKVLQTYGDGSVVSWIDQTTPGGPEPEFPAPTLMIAAASGAVDGHGATTAAEMNTVAPAAATDDSSGTAVTLAVIALVASLVSLLGIGYLIAVSRRRPQPPASVQVTDQVPVGASSGA